MSPDCISYVYVIVLPLVELNVAVLSVLLPNFIFSVGAVLNVTAALLAFPYIFSLYVATIVTTCPALYVPAAGLVTFILDSVGAVVSATIAFPPIVLFDTDVEFPATSYIVLLPFGYL